MKGFASSLPASRAFGVAVLAIAVVAFVLRVWRIGQGLPDFLEEAIPLRLALGLTDAASGRIDLNPHQFNYPSLSVYLHFGLQWILYQLGRLGGLYASPADYQLAFDVDPSPMAIPARLVGVVADLFALVGVARIGERLARHAGLVAAGLVAIAPVLVTTSHAVFCDSIMAAFAVWSVERLLAWLAGERPRDLALAAIFLGLATGSKYPAAVLFAPLAVAVLVRRGRAGLRLVAGAAALAAFAFLLSTPYAVLSPQEFLRDVRFEGGHAEGGHLGSLGHRSFLFHLGNFVASLGAPGALLALGAGVLAFRRELPRLPVALVALAVLGFGLPISLARIDAERYVVPVVLLAAPLAGAALVALAGRLPAARRGIATGIALLLLFVPNLFGGLAAAGRGGASTETAAREWCERHLGPRTLLVQEGYSATLPTVLGMRRYQTQPIYLNASPRARTRVDTLRVFHVVAMPLKVAGTVVTRLGPPGGGGPMVTLFDHASELNRVFYDPRLYAGADWFMTSSAVRGRFTADPARYPVECAFYERLDRTAPVVARFAPDRKLTGPEIVVYRLDERFRRALEAEPALTPIWWTEAIPPARRAEIARILAGNPEAGTGIDVRALATFYQTHLAPFISDLASEYVLLDRDTPARALALATLAVLPDDLDASTVLAIAVSRAGEWSTASAIATRVIARHSPEEAMPFRLLRARWDMRLGRTESARGQLAALVADAAAPPGVRRSARVLLDSLATGSPARP